MNFYLGCAVWTYKGWVGDFYAPKTPTKDFLRLYSQRLTTVEGNTTFYAIPDEATIARWGSETPEGFKFCLKLPREFTHNGLLVPSIPEVLSFLKKMEKLDHRLGPIFAQLPPSYSPASLEDLSTFLKALPCQKIPLALEVRHLDWFQDPYRSQLNTLLTDLGVGRVLLDSRPVYHAPEHLEVPSARRKPNLPLEFFVTANFALIRFISHPQQALNQSFLQEWVIQVERWLRQGITLYFFVHCPTEARSPHNARYFQQLLEESDVNVPLLPWNQREVPPQQLSLF
ncbi:MAG: DUF72 domain-containing protein [Microcystaceae cyanobacterium]